jgi:hypothetical protein
VVAVVVVVVVVVVDCAIKKNWLQIAKSIPEQALRLVLLQNGDHQRAQKQNVTTISFSKANFVINIIFRP